jgi:hypothetical protein
VGGCCAGLQCFQVDNQYNGHNHWQCARISHCPDGEICPGKVSNETVEEIETEMPNVDWNPNSNAQDSGYGDTSGVGCKGYDDVCYGSEWGDNGPCCAGNTCYQMDSSNWYCRPNCPSNWHCAKANWMQNGVLDTIAVESDTNEYAAEETTERNANIEFLGWTMGIAVGLTLLFIIAIWAGVYAFFAWLAEMARQALAGSGRQKTQKMRSVVCFCMRAQPDKASSEHDEPAFTDLEERASGATDDGDDPWDPSTQNQDAKDVLNEFQENEAARQKEMDKEKADKKAKLQEKLASKKKKREENTGATPWYQVGK